MIWANWSWNKIKSALSKPAAPKTIHGGGFSGGGFRGLRQGSSLSGGGKWQSSLSDSGSGTQIDHFTTRQNARRAFHETIQARALIERYADTVVDIGLIVQPDPKIRLLGITAEEAENWSSVVEDSFDCWAKSKKQAALVKLLEANGGTE